MPQLIGINLSMEDLAAVVAEAVTRSSSTKFGSEHKKRLLTTEEVETEYGIPKRTMERWRASGHGPSYSVIGRRVYYARDILDGFIEACKVQTTGKTDD